MDLFNIIAAADRFEDGFSSAIDQIAKNILQPHGSDGGAGVLLAAIAEAGGMPGLVESALNSWYFKDRFNRIAMDRCPEISRTHFLHIPKCAGTSITRAYIDDTSYLFLPYPSQVGVMSEVEWRGYIVDVCNSLRKRYFSHFFQGGHIRLEDLLSLGSVRNGDDLFTVVRDPIKMIRSWVNFVLGQIARSESDLNEPSDEQSYGFWLKELGFNHKEPLSSIAPKELVERIIDRVIPDNVLCDFLGKKNDALATIEMIKESGIKVLFIDQLPEFFRRNNWYYRVDNSHKRLGKRYDIFDDFDLNDYIDRKIAEDIRLFDLLVRNRI